MHLIFIFKHFNSPQAEQTQAVDTLLFLHIFNALFFKIMWEVIRVIRETNGRLVPDVADVSTRRLCVT